MDTSRSQPLLTFPHALHLVMEHAAGLAAAPPVEIVPLAAATGRILAAPIIADRNLPPFRRSTRDGYAVNAANLATGQPSTIIGTIPAGSVWPPDAVWPSDASPLQPDQCLAIMTGAPVPASADAVLMIEHAVRSGNQITLAADRKISPGENIVPEGAEAHIGDTLVTIGARLTPAEIALAATCGVTAPAVYVQPCIAILSTGDELVDAAATPQPAQVRNSNGPALESLLQNAGALPATSQILPDNTDAIEAALRAVLSSDANLLLLSGGVSVGEYDLVEAALFRLGAEFLFTGVAIQPGKPVVFGRLPRENSAPLYFFGLPGNPVSVQVCFLLFVQPFLSALAGAAPSPPRFAQAMLGEDIETKPGLTKFLPAKLTAAWDGSLVRRVPWQGSGDLTANARANCYLVLPPDAELLPLGSIVTVLLR